LPPPVSSPESPSTAYAAGRLEQVHPLPFSKPIGQIGVDVAPKPDPDLDPEGQLALPKSIAAKIYSEYGTIRYGIMPVQPVVIPAPALARAEFCHLPLYFEDAKLERYGQSVRILQPIVSGVRFFATVPVLPLKMVVEPPRQCTTYRYPYEAGRCAPP
jgi:hypothetical protein